ncbi:MAG: SDR family oxidoreductase [Mangrovibacterium sp.]
MKDKVVLITGASSGIGKSLAYEFVKNGSKVVLGARRVDRLQAILQDLGAEHVAVCELDVTKEDDCRCFVDYALRAFGAVDVLINNAGISMRADFKDTELSVVRRVMDVNFWGTVYCTKYALPHLLASRGSLVGVISIAGYVGLPGRTGYSSSKFAVRGFLDTLRIENKSSGLHVLVAAPGFTASEVRFSALTADGHEQGETPRAEEKMMTSEEVASRIYKSVKKRNRQLILTFWEGRFTVFLGKFWPRLLDKLTYWFMKKEVGTPIK